MYQDTVAFRCPVRVWERVILLSLTIATGSLSAQSLPDPQPASGGSGTSSSVDSNETPVVVYAATRTAQSLSTTATTSTVITQKQLQDGQYAYVSDALREVPGISVVPSGSPGQQTSVFIHGNDSNSTLFLIDGRRQPVGLSGAYDFANLTLDNVQQIEVVKSPSSSLQGGSASGGVINLVTLSGKGLDHPVSSASFESGSYSTYHSNVQSRGTVGGFDYAVSGSQIASDFNRPNENYRNYVYRGNFGYQFTPDIYFDLHTGYSLANAGSPNAIQYPDPIGRLETEDWFFSPEIKANVTDFYTMKFYYTRDEFRQNYHDLFFNAPIFFGPTSQRTQINTNSIDWQNEFRVASNWTLIAGIQGDDVNAYLQDDIAGARSLQNGLSNIGGFLGSQWEPLLGLHVLSSIRYDHYSDYSGALSWRQGVSYQIPQSGTIIHASGSSSYTPPPAQDLYFPGFSNPALKPETSLSWEAGLEQPFLDGRLTPSATYFHNSITDYIEFPPPTFIPFNVGQATTDGAEIELKAKPLYNLTLDVNYTYLNATDDTRSVRLVRRPRHSLNFSADWKPIDALTLTCGGGWVVDRQDFDPVAFSQSKAPDYFTIRAAVTYKINQNVSIWLRGENLSDTHYQPVLGFPALGLNSYGGIKVSF